MNNKEKTKIMDFIDTKDYEKKKPVILIIDDSKANILALTHFLMDDYVVLAAKSGSAGLSIARDQTPDIILLDIVMPDMDGYQVLQELKHDNRTRIIPVIFISGLTSQEDEAKGLKYGASDYISKPFNEPIVKLRVANQIRMLEQLRKIETTSMTDSLTELPNRMGIELHFKNVWEKCQCENLELSVFMMDIDDFKKFNDEHGHLHGDYVLKHVADVLRQSIKRKTDFVGRWGGEEFLAILPNSNKEHSLEVAETIQETLKAFTRRQVDKKLPVHVTISIGIFCETPSSEELTTEEYISRADKALYKAKQEGKDKAVMYTSDFSE